MNANPLSWKRTAVDIFTLLARWLLGAAFIYLGLNKALHPVDFLKLMQQYDITQNILFLNCIAAGLPWFEVFCGLLLLLGVAVRGTALTLLLMLVPFTILVFYRASILQALQDIPFCAVKFDCGCGTGEEFVCRKLLENCLLVLLSIVLLAGQSCQWCLRFSLSKPRPQ
jgi:putative oxidoreductase